MKFYSYNYRNIVSLFLLITLKTSKNKNKKHLTCVLRSTCPTKRSSLCSGDHKYLFIDLYLYIFTDPNFKEQQNSTLLIGLANHSTGGGTCPNTGGERSQAFERTVPLTGLVSRALRPTRNWSSVLSITRSPGSLNKFETLRKGGAV